MSMIMQGVSSFLTVVLLRQVCLALMHEYEDAKDEAAAALNADDFATPDLINYFLEALSPPRGS